jgi:hypothetical protein
VTSTQVQRTLVKSPPELWAELGDPAALARHLGELGDIRITRIEPEHRVEWTAEGASGTVLIKPSAWGTRVTLTASRKPDEPGPAPGPGALVQPPYMQASVQAHPEPSAPASDPHPSTGHSDPPAPVPEPPPAIAPTEPAVAQAEPPGAAAAEPPRAAAEAPRAQAEPARATTQATAEPLEREQPREAASAEMRPPAKGVRRFFAQALRRVRREELAEVTASAAQAHPPEQPSPAPAESLPAAAHEDAKAQPAPTAPAPQPTESIVEEPPRAPSPQGPPEQEPPRLHSPNGPPEQERPGAPSRQGPPEAAREHPGSSSAGEPLQRVAPPADDVAAVLTSVLDKLGAAHHRPFSRA